MLREKIKLKLLTGPFISSQPKLFMSLAIYDRWRICSFCFSPSTCIPSVDKVLFGIYRGAENCLNLL